MIYARTNNKIIDNVKLNWMTDGYAEKIWLFGDSYFTYWPPYLRENGYTNNMLFGYPGMKSAVALRDFKTSLNFGIPQYVVWCMGMNDKDGQTEINASYKACVDEFLAICEEKGITPILVTIPQTPTVNNQFKNAFIRSSGYRYADFERVVVKNAETGEWYEGMLKDDNVHPTSSGARALYMQLLVDFPEIMAK